MTTLTPRFTRYSERRTPSFLLSPRPRVKGYAWWHRLGCWLDNGIWWLTTHARKLAWYAGAIAAAVLLNFTVPQHLLARLMVIALALFASTVGLWMIAKGVEREMQRRRTARLRKAAWDAEIRAFWRAVELAFPELEEPIWHIRQDVDTVALRRALQDALDRTRTERER